jgi:hypothetical protein
MLQYIKEKIYRIDCKLIRRNLFVSISLISLLFLWSCADDYSKLKVPFPAPTELSVTRIDGGTVKLSWKDNSRAEEGFVIEKSVIGTTDISQYKVGRDITEWIDNEVVNQTYRYKLYAFYQERNSDAVSIVYQHIPVNEPGNIQIVASGDKTELSWTAPTGNFDGYQIERKLNQGSFTVIANPGKEALGFTDLQPPAGLLTYRLYAVQGNYKSIPVDKSLQYFALPQIVINNLTSSYLHLSPNFTLTSDGGEPCTVGVCWSTAPNPTIQDKKSTWHVKLSSGAGAFAPATHSNTSETIYMRAFTTNSGGTSYSNEVSGTLLAEPAAINLSWNAMPAVNASLPAEIRAFETSTQLNGRNFRAYYLIADMSGGNIELKTVLSSTALRPSAHINALSNETVYAMVNGGYFGYNGAVAVSYSLVVDRSQKLADNIGALTRGSFTYPVTRGAFGVSQNQLPAVKWVTGNFSYDIPSPNVEGETPQPSLSNTFPAQSQNWNVFSAIGGAPVLLKDGKMVFDFTTTASGKFRTNYELLQTDIFSTTARPPRTVIANTADNKIVLFVCDGRQAHSDGATLMELAQIMKGLGCVNALNLDGGGSTAMVAGGSLLNKPSDGSERAVPSVVGFVKRK